MLAKVLESAYRLSAGKNLNDIILDTLLNRLSSLNRHIMGVSIFVLGTWGKSEREIKPMVQGNYNKTLLSMCGDGHWVLFVLFRYQNNVHLFDSYSGVIPVEEIANTMILPLLRLMGGTPDEIEVDLDVSQTPPAKRSTPIVATFTSAY
ncbi:hypothetical protein ColLi_09134 [Colletotrichum liriopes]|uniref:Uncharacterized protein n=1 Tax=Colletotrichum liriopes TaxID=708192 RepID=A0AA37GS90_9PEZI|nr:hypothetical protein ColLi_09134 [Colletotrichum liriopes]